MSNAKLILEDQTIELPIIEGSEGEKGIDVTNLRTETGYITFDPAYGNTGSCTSDITFIDGEQGILRYRGIPIEQLAEKSSFVEVCFLLIYGKLPTQDELNKFRYEIRYHSMIHEDFKRLFDGYPMNAHPMGVLASTVGALSTFYPRTENGDIDLNIVRLLAKVKTLAAFSYKKSIGQPFVYPRNDVSFEENFLYTMFSVPAEDYNVEPVMVDALRLLLVLHADHEQNCSTATVRMVGSSLSNLFISIAGGIAALWGQLHGGANQKVIEMLQMIHDDDQNYQKYVDMAKDKKTEFKLFGFGHRVYKNFDPRARILKGAADRLLERLGVSDPLLQIAMELEQIALKDDYFIERKLYPNVDFYSGIIYRAMGIPTQMFTVMFALGRLPGWIAQWKEMSESEDGRINRPRQIYIGNTLTDYIPIDKR
ncbi:MAG: citrate synthase [Candidatus Marinimicrobia bacterium]|jgi:citrate synthase|nr:citrate synthase [Candidatus Neomarinimicrobiota bacterium]MDP6569409.1 citrate synthase [Candidatus Neomarinimicrobiota bacterium]MDP7026496.1 citrate synthase [Candidatus Neomarinimicrobiota bacterium]|tara:strand:+ start:7294 stop:8565 length:1272 start_codon:yes stop_codon:yes gene_type:complete